MHLWQVPILSAPKLFDTLGQDEKSMAHISVRLVNESVTRYVIISSTNRAQT